MNRDNSKKQRIPDKRLLALSIGLGTIIVLGLIGYKTFFQTQNAKFCLKAAIIDQLSQHSPNEAFKNETTDLLRDIGFNVSYFESEAVNVTFYKELAKSAYGIIILRVHSALRANETIVDLFTSEKYDENKYLEDQKNGLLTKGKYLFEQGSEQFYFAITPTFIENLEGSFPKSVVIAMGCWSLRLECEEMAEAFIRKGAEAYVGWTDIVFPQDTDHETATLLEMFLAKNETLADAVEQTKPHTYPAYGITSGMEFYPPSVSVGNLKISDLIAEAKNSKTLTTFNNSERFPFLITNVNFKSKDFLTH